MKPLTQRFDVYPQVTDQLRGRVEFNLYCHLYTKLDTPLSRSLVYMLSVPLWDHMKDSL